MTSSAIMKHLDTYSVVISKRLYSYISHAPNKYTYVPEWVKQRFVELNRLNILMEWRLI